MVGLSFGFWARVVILLAGNALAIAAYMRGRKQFLPTHEEVREQFPALYIYSLV